MQHTAPHWPYTFAPKRQTWHASFFAPSIDHVRVVVGVFNASLFLFVMVFITTQVPRLGASLPVAQVASVSLAAGTTAGSALTEATGNIAAALHVPSGYVTDTPTFTNNSFPRSLAYEDDLHTVAQFAPLAVESFGETTELAWQKSFGAVAEVFVVSVYEFTGQLSATLGHDLNTASVWDAWTSTVAQGLYVPDSPVQMLLR